MPVARTTEISSSSCESFEDAIRRGIARASSRERQVQSAWVKEQTVSVENGRISGYRVDLAITFALEAKEDMSAGAC